MLDWIEKAGGSKPLALVLAPVIRSLAKAETYPLVCCMEEPSSGDLTDQKVPRNTLTVDLNGVNELTSLIERLKSILPSRLPGQSIIIPEIGEFLLKPARTAASGQRLQGKVCLVTGGAQGFGEGIARELAAEGARIVIADLNLVQAEKVAASLTDAYGEDAAIALAVDVGDENSVRQLIEAVTLHFGGLDLLVSNAGILRAGGLEEMTLQSFELVTKINYTAFFLVAKYGSRPMKIQASVDPSYSSDIVQINSKSGLEGSNRNFAYAGGKFGGIGLVQSFAKELVENRIKVNAVCPGNFYEGPLWSDPEKGLFVQYLQTGKVPGAKTIQDVYDFYVGKVPMRRGCSPADVTRAIVYCVEQQYETGQAIPVTGGQNMLK